jgi:hypothetical protein
LSNLSILAAAIKLPRTDGLGHNNFYDNSHNNAHNILNIPLRRFSKDQLARQWWTRTPECAKTCKNPRPVNILTNATPDILELP